MLLSAELPPPALSPSRYASRCRSLIWLDRSPDEHPGLPQPHASVCACACVRVCLPAFQHTGSQRGASASTAPPGTATSCRQFLCQHQVLHNTHSHRQPLRLPVKNNKDTREGGRLLLVSFSLCVYLCIPSAFSSSPQTLTFSQFVYFVVRSGAVTPHSLSLTPASKTVVSHHGSVIMKFTRRTDKHTHIHTRRNEINILLLRLLKHRECNSGSFWYTRNVTFLGS